jgi:hypothetical protein
MVLFLISSSSFYAFLLVLLFAGGISGEPVPSRGFSLIIMNLESLNSSFLKVFSLNNEVTGLFAGITAAVAVF